MSRVSVTFYTRPGCHLCDDAKAAMIGWAHARGFSIELREVNIDEDARAHQRFWVHIPVAMIGDVEAFRHRFDPDAFERVAREVMEGTGGESKMSDLANGHCVPCRGDVPALRSEAIAPLLERLGGGWTVVGDHHLVKEFLFDDFAGALALVNRIGAVAEAEGHHPDIELGWGRVGVTIWTHKIDGLTDSDFVLAAKIDRVVDAGEGVEK
ncbi:MAG: 4a-hydroxytetrahydrobiopterin dehydratase [Thermoanaerobaculia bacterium]